VTVEVARAERAGLLQQRVPFRLLITDIVLPGLLDGFALARRAREFCPSIPIIYTTGYLHAAHIRAHGAPYGEILVKPWKVEKLLMAISTALGERCGVQLADIARTRGKSLLRRSESRRACCLDISTSAHIPTPGDRGRPMTRARAITGAMCLSVIAGAAPALAGQQVYTYSVVHPIYGKIGTLTDTIDRSLETTRIDACLRIAVKFLGIVAYREESDTTEIMRGDRLISLQSVTEKDGRHLEVHGEVQGDRFVVNATAGSFAGPATTAPSDPWALKRTGDETVVLTDTGRIITVHISGGDYDTVSVNGASVSARHFIVMGIKRQEVWLDYRKIPVMFRTVEDGTAIDFVLRNATAAAGAITGAAVKRVALARPETGDE
jgi:CheY-like chemotaxis protein